jgi:hypothetical protein
LCGLFISSFWGLSPEASRPNDAIFSFHPRIPSEKVFDQFSKSDLSFSQQLWPLQNCGVVNWLLNKPNPSIWALYHQSGSDRLENSQLTCGDITIICQTVH